MQSRSLPKFGAALVLLLGPLGIGCGPSRSSAAFEVTPETPTVLVGERLALEALASEDQAGDTEWEVLETYGGGLLQTKGPRVTYVAPAAAGTYHIRLRALRPGSGSLKQDLAILVVPQLRMEPANPTLAPGGTANFTIRQKGLPRGTFSWAVEEPEGGSIGADGHYRAPAARGAYRVTATSTEDKTATVSTTVTVQ